MAQETCNLTVRVPVNRQRQIDAIASQTDRSRNWLINQAIETYLDLYSGQSKRIEAALANVQSKGKGLMAGGEDVQLSDGAALVAHWQHYGIIGSRPDIEDSQTHARQLRKDAESRNHHPIQ